MALAVIAALAAPAGSAAQNAGDEQYADPFGPSEKDTSGGGKSGDGRDAAQPTDGSGSSAPATAGSASDAARPQSTDPPAAGPELARTGPATWPLAGTGVTLLLFGGLLRRRLA